MRTLALFECPIGYWLIKHKIHFNNKLNLISISIENRQKKQGIAILVTFSAIQKMAKSIITN